MPTMNTISPCLWLDDQAEEAARFYVGVFNGKIGNIVRYTEVGQETHGRPPGSVMTVEFELAGETFTALNGGPAFRFNEAVSFQVHCDTQEELDRIWDALGEGADPAAQHVGWLKDRYGLHWQIIPRVLGELMQGPNAGPVMAAMLRMKKLDIATLLAAGT